MSPRRSDAARNRQALLDSALHLFSARGPDVALDAIAAGAGVSIATLYRNFDGRTALLTAVFQREIDALADVGTVLAGADAATALADWVARFVEYTRTKAALAAVLYAMPENERPTARTAVVTALTRILQAGVRDGTLHADLEADDLLAALRGLWSLPDTPDRSVRVDRLAALVVRGASTGIPPVGG